MTHLFTYYKHVDKVVQYTGRYY